MNDERGTMIDEVLPQRTNDLRQRTRKFASDIVRAFSVLPRRTEAQIIGRQMLRSGTSVGAHYREAHRSRSTAEFVSKLETALQELDETSYWLELLADSSLLPAARINTLAREADELTAILVASCKTAKQRR